MTITTTVSLTGEPLDVFVAVPTAEPPIGVVRIGHGNDVIQSREPELLLALSAALAEAASRLSVARGVFDAQQLAVA